MNFLAARLGASGLVDVGYRFITAAGAFSGARQSSGIFEFPGTRGVYGVASPSVPNDAVGVYWDSTGTAAVYAYEFFNPRFPNVDTNTAGALLTSGTGTAQLSVGAGTVTVGTIQAGAIDAASLDTSATESIASSIETILTGSHGEGSWQTNDFGAGAFTITVTVTDGTDPIENASVRVTNGAQSYPASTDASGQAQFALDAGTYAVAVTKLGYSFTPETRTVTGNEAGTLTADLEMMQTGTVTPPADPAKCRVYAYVYDKTGRGIRNAELSATLSQAPAAAGGILLAASIKALSDETGYVALDLYLTDGISPADTQWIIEIPAAGYSRTTALTTATLDLGTLIT